MCFSIRADFKDIIGFLYSISFMRHTTLIYNPAFAMNCNRYGLAVPCGTISGSSLHLYLLRFLYYPSLIILYNLLLYFKRDVCILCVHVCLCIYVLKTMWAVFTHAEITSTLLDFLVCYWSTSKVPSLWHILISRYVSGIIQCKSLEFFGWIYGLTGILSLNNSQ